MLLIRSEAVARACNCDKAFPALLQEPDLPGHHIAVLRRRVERAGFRVEAVLGGYDGAPWRADADTWAILATRV